MFHSHIRSLSHTHSHNPSRIVIRIIKKTRRGNIASNGKNQQKQMQRGKWRLAHDIRTTVDVQDILWTNRNTFHLSAFVPPSGEVNSVIECIMHTDIRKQPNYGRIMKLYTCTCSCSVADAEPKQNIPLHSVWLDEDS